MKATVAATILIAISLCAGCQKQKKQPKLAKNAAEQKLDFCTPDCSECVMHRPDSGCPAGWDEKPNVFILKDEDVPGCVKVQPEIKSDEPGFWGMSTCLDMLRPHEGMSFNLAPFPPPEAPKPKKKEMRKI